MKQQLSVTQINRKHTESKVVQRDRYHKGHYWVQSTKHAQLYYKVILTDDKLYCAYKAWKFGGGQLYKHIFKVMEIDAGIGRSV